MKLSIEHPSSLSKKEQHAINEVASSSFGVDNPADMLDDTIDHLHAAEYVQQAVVGREVVGFALYRSVLWRQSD
jgi:hypothetical protein